MSDLKAVFVMTDPSSLKWLHRTQLGSERTENKDCFSIINIEFGTWFFVIDIATSSNATAELVESFSDYFLDHLMGLLKSEDNLSPVKSSQGKSCQVKPFQEKPFYDNYFEQEEHHKLLIQKAFVATKKALKIGVASFLSLHRSEHSNSVVGSCAGDCRLGLLKNKTIQWLTPVHTGANPLGNDFENSMALLPERHILTKSLNLRRHFDPETFKYKISADDIFVLATDGFWLDLNEADQQTFIKEPELFAKNASLVDDTSVLLVTWADLEQDFIPKFMCNLSSEFKTSSHNVKIKDNNLIVIRNRSIKFSDDEDIAEALSKKLAKTFPNTEKNNEY